MDTNKLELISVGPDETILFALKRMDAIGRKVLIVKVENQFIGLITIGDIQRSLISNISLNSSISKILRDKFDVASPFDDYENIKNRMILYRVEIMPVIDLEGQITDVLFWEDLFEGKKPSPFGKFDLPIVIMAGGKGTRLRPLTNILPKPLIPIGEKTMLEEIFDRFTLYGCNRFYISVNYKADLIEYYINKLDLGFTVNFFREEKPLGTAGSLFLLREKLKETFFVTNCDILIEQDYSEILQYHKQNKNEITIIAALKHLEVPYGIIETGINGQLSKLEEKPELIFKINSGMYIIEPGLLYEIPDNHFYHINDLIELTYKKGGKVGVFPISQKSWKDVGSLNDYFNLLNIKHNL